MISIATSSVVFRSDLYPRLETSATTVQKYAEDLSVLPPIEVNQHNELIDGWHRWTAHKKNNVDQINVTVTETKDDADLFYLGMQRNSRFGLQLSRSDKMSLARKIYRKTSVEERGQSKQRLADALSVSYATVNKWLSRIDKDTTDERNCTVMDLWLRCYTEQEIADNVGCSRDLVHDVLCRIQEFEISTIPSLFTEDQPEESAVESVKDAWERQRREKIVQYNRDNANHVTDFKVPIYNVWKQQEKTEGSGHFGNSEVRWLDNLLYMYTNPFDIVVDPFGGGGSTLDLCRDRLRRCWISDRKPIEDRKKEIRRHDLVTDNVPDLRKRWSDVRLVYLDPPYWKQAQGQYSDDPTDLANMPLEQFNETLSDIIKSFATKLKNGEPSYIALIIQPTQWNAPERQFTDHIGDMLRLVKLPVDMRFSVPYESQQYNAQMVQWAKDNKKCLVLTREIIVWRCE